MRFGILRSAIWRILRTTKSWPTQDNGAADDDRVSSANRHLDLGEWCLWVKFMECSYRFRLWTKSEALPKYLPRESVGFVAVRLSRQRHRNKLPFFIVQWTSRKLRSNIMMNTWIAWGSQFVLPHLYLLSRFWLWQLDWVGQYRFADLAFSTYFPLYLYSPIDIDSIEMHLLSLQNEWFPSCEKAGDHGLNDIWRRLDRLNPLPVMFQLVAPRYVSGAAAPALYLVLSGCHATLTGAPSFIPYCGW
jgi:hypothetical protein